NKLSQHTMDIVKKILSNSQDVDAETAGDVASADERRMILANDAGAQVETDRSAHARAVNLMQAGKLNDETIQDALSLSQRLFVTHALALMTGSPLDLVRALLEAQSPRGITALAWRAGLCMRTALELQVKLAKIPHQMVLNAKDG